MDQVTNGLYSVFSFANVYDAFQILIGESYLKKQFIEKFVCPFPGAKVLDIGCGTATLLKHLPEEVEYVGFDLNPNYIAHARKRYGHRGSFFCERVSDATVKDLGQFDFVLAGGVLHHLGDREAQTLFATAYDCLKPGGAIVTFDNVFVDDQSSVARYIISKDRGQHVRTPEQYMALARKSFGKLQAHIRHDLLRIPYTHFIMKCVKSAPAAAIG